MSSSPGAGFPPIRWAPRFTTVECITGRQSASAAMTTAGAWWNKTHPATSRWTRRYATRNRRHLEWSKPFYDLSSNDRNPLIFEKPYATIFYATIFCATINPACLTHVHYLRFDLGPR